MNSAMHRELLLADVAVELGLVPAAEMAEILARWWESREGSVLADLPCGQRERVEAEVERLVGAAHGDARTALAVRGVDRRLPASMPPAASHEFADDGTPLRAPLRNMGRERYLGFMPLAEGGMGVVYLALDSELNRRVAFKMIRAGDTDPMAAESGPVDRHVVARFLQEAVVTGGLEHPGIVPVYELGQTPAGVPYYTMRFVRGERTLEDAIDAASTIEDRFALLEPFLKVCDAVGYAHSRGVIHRDIKPANVALGQFGEVVVLDWGLAKMKGRPDVSGTRWQSRLDDLRETTDLKTLASALGTPGYMSPEAARAEIDKVDRRSDVYSLGAMLYRLLTGVLPHAFETFAQYAAAQRQPVRAVPGAPPGLARICQQALARKRADRYQQVGDLATAIRAWQTESAIDREVDGLVQQAEETLAAADGLESDALLRQLDRVIAVSAQVQELRPGHGTAEDLGRRARESRDNAIAQRERHARMRVLKRAAIVGLGLAMLATAAFAVLLDGRRREAEDAQAREAEHRHAAEGERARAEELARFMLNDLHDGLEPVGRLDLLGSVARKSLEYYESLPAANMTDETLHARALAIGQIGEVLTHTGELTEALVSCQESQRILADLVRRNPQSTVFRESLALAMNRTGDVLQETGELEAGLEHYQESAALRRSLTGLDAEWDLSRSLDRVGEALARLGQTERAREPFAESLEIRRRLVNHDPRNADWLRSLSISVEREGEKALAASDVASARRAFEESLAIRTDLLAQDKTRTDRQDDVAACLFRIAWCHEVRGERPEALARYREALAIYRRLIGVDALNKNWQRGAALCLEREGDVLLESGDVAAARERHLDALEVKRLLARRDTASTRARHDISNTLLNLGDLSKRTGDLGAAMDNFVEALAIARELVAEEPANTEWTSDVVDALLRIGKMRREGSRLTEARSAISEALAIVRRLRELDPSKAEWRRNEGLALDRLAELESAAGNDGDAIRHFEASLELKRALAARDATDLTHQKDLAWLLGRLGGLDWRAGELASALERYQEELPARRRIVAAEPTPLQRRDLAVCLLNAGLLIEAEGRTDEALETFLEAEEIHGGAAGYAEEHAVWRTSRARVEASVCYASKDFAGAMRAYEDLLQDADSRSDLRSGHLYNAACSAALAGAAGKALAWLAEDLALRRSKLTAEQLRAHVEHAHTNDPDLASLRGTAEFEALFED